MYSLMARSPYRNTPDLGFRVRVYVIDNVLLWTPICEKSMTVVIGQLKWTTSPLLL